MKQEFKMEQSEMDSIININKNIGGPVMMIGNYVSGIDLQDNINNYWVELGNKYGFKSLTVEPSAKGNLYFLAEPKPIEIPKTESEKSIDKYLDGFQGYVSGDVKSIIGKIINQLESCNYENQAGNLENNVAFLALKKLSNNSK